MKNAQERKEGVRAYALAVAPEVVKAFYKSLKPEKGSCPDWPVVGNHHIEEIAQDTIVIAERIYSAECDSMNNYITAIEENGV